jgi:2,3-dihydroxybenzoate-AMP ligase
MTDVPPWPAEFACRYREAGYWLDRPLGHWMWQWADEHGDRTALTDGDTRLSFRDLAELADELATHLIGQGLRSGDRILVQLPNCWEFVVLLLACFRAGVAPVLALMPHREHELVSLIDQATPKLLVVCDRWRDFDHQELAARIFTGPVAVVGSEVHNGHFDVRESLRREDVSDRRAQLDRRAPDADEIALFLLSGGTTGIPKLIGRTHNDYEYCWRAIAAHAGVGPETVYLVVLPAAHNFALGGPGILGTLAAGGRVVLTPSPSPRTVFELIARESVTMTSVVPAVAQRWLEAAGDRPDLDGLALVQIGGSVLDPGLARRLRDGLGVRLQQVFGMAEGLLNCTRPTDDDEVVLHTQGRPISEADEILIVGEDGEPVPPGEVGELLTRGPYTPRGYFRAEAHNRSKFTLDGWYRTGDLVRLHASGNLVVEGRSKDLINRGGEKISADEIESLARELLDLTSVAVIPLPDSRLGERICLVVVPAPDRPVPALDTIRRLFQAHGVAHFKLPEQVEALPALPLTPIGKVDKKAVRQRILAVRDSRQPAGPPRTQLQKSPLPLEQS